MLVDVGLCILDPRVWIFGVGSNVLRTTTQYPGRLIAIYTVLAINTAKWACDESLVCARHVLPPQVMVGEQTCKVNMKACVYNVE